MLVMAFDLRRSLINRESLSYGRTSRHFFCADEALRQSSESESTFDEEVALARAYLDIEQMRFPDRLSIFFEIAPGTELALVPVLLLQPLVETPSTTA